MKTFDLIPITEITQGILIETDRFQMRFNTSSMLGMYLRIDTSFGEPVFLNEDTFTQSETEDNRYQLRFTIDEAIEEHYVIWVNATVAGRLQGSDLVYRVTDLESGNEIWLTRSLYNDMQREDLIHGTRDAGTVFGDLSDLYLSEDGTIYRSEFRRDQHDETRRNDPNNYREPYHHSAGVPKFHRFGIATPRYLCGIEIEKEDYDILRSISLKDFRSQYPKWRKESDGSLSHETGYELVSPTFELDPDLIIQYIERDDLLKDHVQAGQSSACGMHANVSDTERTPWELFDDLVGYLPVLCALYPKRVENDYCKAKTKKDLIQYHEKKQAFCVKSDRVEIRIFAAVTDLKNLRFRLDLIEFMMKNPAPSPKMINFEALSQVMNQIHKTENQRNKFSERVTEFTNRYRM
jgi:hypothetical protein